MTPKELVKTLDELWEKDELVKTGYMLEKRVPTIQTKKNFMVYIINKRDGSKIEQTYNFEEHKEFIRLLFIELGLQFQ